jgi:hypothetical protein
VGLIVGNVWFDHTLLVAKWRRSTAIPRKCLFPKKGFAVEAYLRASQGTVHRRHVVSLCALGRNWYGFIFGFFQRRQWGGSLTIIGGFTPCR